MLFSAGAGLTGLRETLDAIDREADRLYAPKRAAHRTFYQAEERLKQASAALRDHSVTVSDWRKLEQAPARTHHECITLKTEIEEKSAEQTRLTRVRRVYRDVRRRAKIEDEIASVGEVKQLREDAVQSLQEAERSAADAAAGIETLTRRIARARAERSKLTFDGELVLHEHDIGQLHERRIAVLNGKADLPGLRGELAGAEADCLRLAADLDWKAEDLERVIARIPPRVHIRAARTLLNQRGGRVAAVDNARVLAEDAARRVGDVRSEIQGSSAADVSNLRAVTGAARNLGDMRARIGAATVQADDERASRDRLLQSLRPAVADEAELATLTVPPADMVVAVRDDLRSVDDRHQHCRHRMEEATL